MSVNALAGTPASQELHAVSPSLLARQLSPLGGPETLDVKAIQEVNIAFLSVELPDHPPAKEVLSTPSPDRRHKPLALVSLVSVETSYYNSATS
jgi:hypothetical protein